MKKDDTSLTKKYRELNNFTHWLFWHRCTFQKNIFHIKHIWGHPLQNIWQLYSENTLQEQYNMWGAHGAKMSTCCTPHSPPSSCSPKEAKLWSANAHCCQCYRLFIILHPAHCVPCNTFGEQREIYEWIRLFFKPPWKQKSKICLLHSKTERRIHPKTAIFNRPIQGGLAHQKCYARVQPRHSVSGIE